MSAVSTTKGRKTWHLLPHDPLTIGQLARNLNVSPIVAQLLLNRKIREGEQARRFLHAPLSGLYEPEQLPGVVPAVDRLMAAIAEKRRIMVYGDYDVDGVTGTAILLTALKLLGASVDFHIPHRLEEGYGLNSETLARLAQEGAQVVVTVDCGIASVSEAEIAHQLGLELIITDHHEPKNTLPRAAALVHPRLTPSDQATPYPFGYLSGSGVAFKLAWALCKRQCGSPKVTPRLRDFLLDGVTLAALGTVADVVPLWDENRILVRHGLGRLQSAPSLGLQALIKAAGLEEKPRLDAGDIGYCLGPRLNAAGRLDTARLAVELLITPSPERATVLARYLEEQNQKRQQLERRVLQEARELADLDPEAPALILANTGWHPGILGIVASRLVDQFGRPALMIALPHDEPGAPATGVAQGSGRSVPGFKLHEALQECGEDLLSHGGHAAAAGFRLNVEMLSSFRQRFCDVARRCFGNMETSQKLVIDAEVPLSSLTPGLVKALEQMEPFGSGNPQPLLLAGDLQIAGEPRRVGKPDRHLSFRVQQNGRDLRAIAFNMGDRQEELMSAAGRCCLVFTPRINDYQGFRSVELEVRDFQPGSVATLNTSF